MPRIEAPTVVEHHQMKRTALIEAAAQIVTAEGVEALTLAAVGSAAGLARSSVYQYFDSTVSLLTAVIEAAIPRAGAHMAAAVSRAGTPEAKVVAWVRAYIRAATDPHHRAMAAGELGLPDECRASLYELHAAQAAPLVAALKALGIEDPELVAALIQGMARAAADQINDGLPQGRVLARTIQVVQAATA